MRRKIKKIVKKIRIKLSNTDPFILNKVIKQFFNRINHVFTYYSDISNTALVVITKRQSGRKLGIIKLNQIKAQLIRLTSCFIISSNKVLNKVILLIKKQPIVN